MASRVGAGLSRAVSTSMPCLFPGVDEVEVDFGQQVSSLALLT